MFRRGKLIIGAAERVRVTPVDPVVDCKIPRKENSPTF